jgi:hypothetical protein
MKGKLTNLGLAGLLVLASASLGSAQTQMGAAARQPNPNSIRPGEVNYIEGQVALNGNNLGTNSLRSTVIQPGDDLSTGQGYAEILLSPGSFLRVGHNSEIRLVTAGLADSQIDIVHGSALLEAADVVKGSAINVTVGNATAHIGEKGLFAFDASAQTVRVFDGKLRLTNGDNGQTTLGKGDQVLLSSDRPLKKHDFNTKAAQEDTLYVWSKVRSHDEAEATMNVAENVTNYGGWYGPGWYWDSAWGFYAFAPGFGYLGGPFGWNYYSPVFLYNRGFYGGRFYGAGYYRGGLYRGGHYAANVRSFGGGFSGAHAMGGGFHGGGGHR